MLLEICKMVDGPISAEVVGVESEAMIKEGRDLAKVHKNIVVKVPLIPEGLRATKKLAAEGIRVNVTLCFSPLAIHRSSRRREFGWNGTDSPDRHDL